MTGWQYPLVIAGVLFLAAIIGACAAAKRRSPVIRYRDVNAPGAFMVGRNVE